jgi:hypothetical protein
VIRRASRQRSNVAEEDLGVALLELLASAADVLSSYQDQVAAEADARTGRRCALVLGAVAIVLLARRRH